MRGITCSPRICHTYTSCPEVYRWERRDRGDIRCNISTLIITGVTVIFRALNLIHRPQATDHSRDNRHDELLTFILTQYNETDTEYYIYHTGPFVTRNSYSAGWTLRDRITRYLLYTNYPYGFRVSSRILDCCTSLSTQNTIDYLSTATHALMYSNEKRITPYTRIYYYVFGVNYGH